MEEGKKQRKFGRTGKRMWVPRGAARALRRALKFWGKLHSKKIGSVTYDYAVSVVGAANTQKLESLYD